MRVWTAVILLAICSFAQEVSAGLQTLEERDVGRWKLVALANEAGVGALCYVVSAGTSNGQLVSITVERGQGWSLEVTNGKDLGDAAEGDLTYSIDGGDSISKRGRAIAPTILSVTLGASYEATEPFRRGNRLQVRYRGEQASFSLKGSSNALDALLACAVRHLDYQDHETKLEPLGTWLVMRKPLEDGSCRVANDGEENVLFIFNHTEEAGYFITISHRGGKWRLRDGEIYELTYSIDNGPPVETHAGGMSDGQVLLDLGKDAAVLRPFENGHFLQVQAQRTNLRLSLQGAMDALEVLKTCAKGFGGQDDADAADPFSSAGEKEGGDSIPEASDPSRPSDPAIDVHDPNIDRTVAAVKTLRLAQVIYAKDPWAEDSLRERLRSALRGVSAGEKQASAMAEAQAFLYSYVESAIKVAPSDVVAKLIRKNLDVMQWLQSQPDHCAAYFKASGAGDLSYLPRDVRLALAEVYADLVEAAASRPVTRSTIGDEEFVAAITEAYAANGFSADDMAKLDEVATLDPAETCRLGTQISIALAWLPEDTAAAIFRKVYSSSP